MAYSGFIVRPFGKRTIRPASGDAPYEIDFDRVQRELIAPAMEAAGIRGSTTEVIAAAGNIREDMFQMLAHADLVVADISVHNANVFYELGARHALRDKHTYLIRYAGDEVPFDLKTDRYLAYPRDNPAAALDALVQGLKETLADTRRSDSPIFGLLPALKPPAIKDLVPVPLAFQEEVARARAGRRLGLLVLLGQEANELPWGAEGLRRVARALRDLVAWGPERDAWEAVRRRLGSDLEADIKLGTVYQRLARRSGRAEDLADSDSAIARALADPALGGWDRAEALSLRASNAKQRWMDSWQQVAAARIGPTALHSNHLRQASKDYADAFAADLNHFYAGVNALTMARIRADLADAFPDDWADGFNSDDEARQQRELLDAAIRDLPGAVQLSVARQQACVADDPMQVRWADISAADVQLLRKDRVRRVAAAYRRALEGAEDQYFEVVQRQWALFARLGLFAEHLAELNGLPTELGYQPGDGAASTPGEPPLRVILFSGHRVDDPGRTKARFPAAMEATARAAIRERIEAYRAAFVPETRWLGLAGGASGGDILFHEVCAELGIATEMYLAMAPNDFIPASVRVDGAPGWIDRFHAIRARCEAGKRLRQLGDGLELPSWLGKLAGYSVWERNNRWELQSALAFGADKVRLLVLWDGQGGDGPGGTEHMKQTAEAAGASVDWIDSRKLFGLV